MTKEKKEEDETNNKDRDNMMNHDDNNSNRTNDFTTHADVITFLRDSFARALSQFHFSQTLRWATRSNDTVTSSSAVPVL